MALWHYWFAQNPEHSVWKTGGACLADCLQDLAGQLRQIRTVNRKSIPDLILLKPSVKGAVLGSASVLPLPLSTFLSDDMPLAYHPAQYITNEGGTRNNPELYRYYNTVQRVI